MRIVEAVNPGQLRAYYALRWEILRAPWKQPRGSERDALDAGAIHLMAVDGGGVLIGVGRLHFNSIREAQIRYMAVSVARQRRGVGTLLLHALEDRAKRLGAASIVLDARETALGFYRKHGYHAIGPGHVLYNCISHVRMQKTL